MTAMSINEWCAMQPKRQHSYEVKGWVLRFIRTDLVMVPYESVQGGWHCVVVVGSAMYPVGGYDLFVSDNEIECAERVEIL